MPRSARIDINVEGMLGNFSSRRDPSSGVLLLWVLVSLPGLPCCWLILLGDFRGEDSLFGLEPLFVTLLDVSVLAGLPALLALLLDLVLMGAIS
jgi:hypothetical protein